jgi:hypothetical protein
MINFALNELKVIREGLECIIHTSDRESVKSAIQKVESFLEKEGYKWERKAFQNEWKKINK